MVGRDDFFRCSRRVGRGRCGCRLRCRRRFRRRGGCGGGRRSGLLLLLGLRRGRMTWCLSVGWVVGVFEVGGEVWKLLYWDGGASGGVCGEERLLIDSDLFFS